MKFAVLTAVSALLLASVAQAETLTFPSDAPVASATFPDTWKAAENDTGIEAFSPDDAVTFYIDVSDTASSEKVMQDGINFLKENGVTIDPDSVKESSGSINGMELQTLDWDGKDAGGDASIGMAFLQPSPEKMLIITYWGTKGEEDKYTADLGAIMQSIKPAE